MLFTIRWWAGGVGRHYFDLVNIPARKLLCPRVDLPDLNIEAEYMGMKYPLFTVEELMRQSRNVQKLSGGSGEERYEVTNGTKLTFFRNSTHIATVFVPIPPPPENEGYFPATINFFNL